MKNKKLPKSVDLSDKVSFAEFKLLRKNDVLLTNKFNLGDDMVTKAQRIRDDKDREKNDKTKAGRKKELKDINKDLKKKNLSTKDKKEDKDRRWDLLHKRVTRLENDAKKAAAKAKKIK